LKDTAFPIDFSILLKHKLILMNNTITKRNYIMPMLIIGALFFIFGFVTWINGTLIPYLRVACELKTDVESYLVATAFFIAYTVMAIPSSMVLGKIGYKKGMSLGLFVMAIGAVMFIPAAGARSYPLFLLGLFIIGTGLAILQTASNPYVSIIGPMESAAKRISIMGICNKVGGILATLIFGYITLKDSDQLTEQLKTMDDATKNITLNELASRVVTPYTIIAGILVILAIAVLFSGLPDIKDEEEVDSTAVDHTTGKTSVFQFPHLLLGVLALFFYVGVEVMAGDTIISYGRSLGIEMANAKYFTTGTLICMLIGYVIGVIAIPKYISQEKALRICAILGVLFTILAVVTTQYVSVACIAALGLANSLMWPAIFPLAINKLGRFTKTGSALLVMAIAGGAILPLVYGWLSTAIHSSQMAYLLMVPGYLFILYFAVKGHKKGLS
jgi:FHS family L-fucose permease-like MFS transporter